MNTSPHRLGTPGAYRLRTAALIVVASGLVGTTVAMADSEDEGKFSERSLRGTWIWSGLLRFGAPVPIPGTIVDGAPPHDIVVPGNVVGVWASTVGLMTFDGAGNVEHAEEVTKVGEIAPQRGLIPGDHLPPFPETFTGSYTVSDHGIVQIALTGRNLSSPDGRIDFEYDLHCVANREPKTMTCVPARLKTYVVDATGYPAPITGLINFERQLGGEK